MKKLKTILIATAVAAVVIPGFAATTNTSGSFTVSLTGYASSEPSFTANAEKLTVTEEVKQEKFKEDTKSLIANIGLAIGHTFTEKAKITEYDFDANSMTITDGDTKIVVTNSANVQIDNDEWASSDKGKSTTTYNTLPVPLANPTNNPVAVKGSGNWQQNSVVSIYWWFRTSATTGIEYDLHVYAPGKGDEKFDVDKGTASESSKVSGAKAVGAITKWVGEDGTTYPVNGTLSASDKTTIK